MLTCLPNKSTCHGFCRQSIPLRRKQKTTDFSQMKRGQKNCGRILHTRRSIFWSKRILPLSAIEGWSIKSKEVFFNLKGRNKADLYVKSKDRNSSNVGCRNHISCILGYKCTLEATFRWKNTISFYCWLIMLLLCLFFSVKNEESMFLITV